MIWAIKNNERIKAEPKQKAICPLCKKEVISKCGEIKIWHWAHKSNKNCDDWYEPESQWHLDWKNKFPKDWQEIIIKKDNKFHIADIKTKNGFVVELQNSSISSKDIRKREIFYNNMIWILNGKTFAKNLLFYKKYNFYKTNYRNWWSYFWKWQPKIFDISKKQIFIDLNNKIYYLKNYKILIELSKEELINKINNWKK